MMAFVVDIFSPHDGSIDLLLLSELFEPTADEGQEGIVGLSVSCLRFPARSVTQLHLLENCGMHAAGCKVSYVPLRRM
jgi:hypothetical protein